MSNIPVVILCGGYGTRLSEETVDKPKPMVEIGNLPIVYHIMKHYAHYGHKRFILALGYKADYIKSFFYNFRISVNDFTFKLNPNSPPVFHGCNDDSDWEITLANTGLETLKGGRIKRIEKFIDSDRFFLTYGDAVSDVNINELLDFHTEHKKIATLTGVNPPSRFGELSLEGHTIKSFEEKPQLSSGKINGGYFVLEKSIMNYLSTETSCDFEFGPMQRLAQEGNLMCFKHPGFWQCMDTLRDKNYLNKLWDSGNSPWKVWK